MSEISTWSATAASNTATPPNGFPEQMSPASLNDAAREVMAAVRRSWERFNATMTSSGSGNTYALTYTVAPTSYIAGECYTFIPNFSNTDAATLNINNLGATAIKAGDGVTALSANAINAGYPTTVIYNGSVFQLVNGVTLTGDVTGTGTGTVNLTLANSGVTANVYGNLTIDVKGRVTAARAIAATDVVGLGSAAVLNTGTSGATIPLLNGTNIWGAVQTFNGELDLVNTIGGPILNVIGNAATNRAILLSTNVSGIATSRFGIIVNNAPESGSNVGSDLKIGRYNDAGTLIDTPLTITRSTGTTALTNLSVSGSVTVTSDVATATVTASGLVKGGSLQFGTNVVGTNSVGNRTASTAAPSGGSAGDLWFQYT